MIRNTVRALCAASLIVAPLALSTPAHAVTCTVNGFPRTANDLTGTPGNDFIRCASIPTGHSVDGLGGNDYITVNGTVASGAAVVGNTGGDYIVVNSVAAGAEVFGGAGNDYLRINSNAGTVDGGPNADYCRVATGAPPINCEV